MGAATARAIGATDTADKLEKGGKFNLPSNLTAPPEWKLGDPIKMPDGASITPSDGILYKMAAKQMQKT